MTARDLTQHLGGTAIVSSIFQICSSIPAPPPSTFLERLNYSDPHSLNFNPALDPSADEKKSTPFISPNTPNPKMPFPETKTQPPGATPAHQPRRQSRLPLYLLRHGSGLIGFGLLFGFVVPMTPYPRLALTAHIQFAVEGTMVLAAGLLLNSDPFPSLSSSAKLERKTMADRLTPLQRRVVYWGCAGIWVTLLSEAANAWWGTRWVLPIAHGAAGLLVKFSGDDGPAEVWMERVVAVAHYPFSVALATVWPVITYALFTSE
ncbi:hypothetical protein B0H63DRAFT_489793 [Podospora didyma]|uniref:Uncharacterized protein n=1 Tax=Podospora didyma TaxID=330526 RepID=A0AAE0N2J6_9PEZI|nr:hypothetical protein B0H63DRAFT_489793 [Podospora didyma]